mmetsp:Transcript_48226/g.142585  ORF Transcript_48226/g.142585 Transcript_48226/m.142585 type:complete len:397 (+) Transcript_48226:930-2120(+)
MQYPPCVKAWLRAPHTTLPYDKGQGNCVRVFLSGVLGCLNRGCAICEPPPPPPPVADLEARLSRSEARLALLRDKPAAPLAPPSPHILRSQHTSEPPASAADKQGKPLGADSVLNALPSQQGRFKDVTSEKELSRDAPAEDAAASNDGAATVNLTARHFIRWECVPEFLEWYTELVSLASTFPGYLSSFMQRSEGTTDDNLFVVTLRFLDAAAVHAWAHDEQRRTMWDRLKPLVAADSLVSATESRALPDTGTDLLLSSTDSHAPLRPPSKWKVVIIFWIGLWMTVYNFNFIWPPILDEIGIEGWQAQTICMATLHVSVVSWIGAALSMKLFGAWLARPRTAAIDAFPWKQLDEGLPHTKPFYALRLVLAAAFYGPLISQWIQNEQKDNFKFISFG